MKINTAISFDELSLHIHVGIFRTTLIQNYIHYVGWSSRLDLKVPALFYHVNKHVYLFYRLHHMYLGIYDVIQNTRYGIKFLLIHTSSLYAFLNYAGLTTDFLRIISTLLE